MSFLEESMGVFLQVFLVEATLEGLMEEFVMESLEGILRGISCGVPKHIRGWFSPENKNNANNFIKKPIKIRTSKSKPAFAF